MLSSSTAHVVGILLVSATLFTVCSGQSGCSTSGWFGDSSCPYQCHCAGGADCDRATGDCPNGCHQDWFGPACQYAIINFPASSSFTSTEEYAWLTDNRDDTCADQDAQTVTVELTTPQIITWVRVVLSNTDHLRQVQLSYRSGDGQEEQTCANAQKAKVNDVTLDISCPTPEVVSHVTLFGDGVASLCSLYISGGRNVALKQTTDQITTEPQNDDWNSEYAVDGDSAVPDASDDVYKKTCSHTQKNSDPAWWRVTWSRDVEATRFVIYNRWEPGRRDCCEQRLIGFTLKAFQDENELFSYTDPNESAQHFYTAVPPSRVTIDKVEIWKGPDSRFLTLCEVLIFGDSACSPGTFGRECERVCHCVDQADVCFVSTGGCPSGCASGYTGEDCWTPCPSGTYGSGCEMTCSDHCGQGSGVACDSITGHCSFGCETGYVPPLCDNECPEQRFGQNCSSTCSGQCVGGLCDHKTGHCDNCPPGFIGDVCDQACPTNTFGDGCRQNCSVHCLDRLCHPGTGVCSNCTAGRTGDFCQRDVLKEDQQQMGEEGGDNSAPIGIIVGAAAGGVAVLVLIVLLFVWRRGRKQRHDGTNGKETGETHRSRLSDPEIVEDSLAAPRSSTPTLPIRPKVSDAKAAPHWPDEGIESVYSNVLSGTTAVGVEDLKAYLHTHAADSFLKDQFESVPMANTYSQSQGLSSENSKKNRYQNIVPYNHSRVLLQEDPGRKYEDYINASYIKDYSNRQSFIASQAPNTRILGDFVRMLWEEQVDRVVMLTNLVELRKIKCTMYWPQEDEETFGEITMKLLTTRVFAEYTIRQIRLTKRGETARTLTQFHFTAWPDKSVPDSPWGLVDFQQRVLATPGSGPLLVHCSAGVGRTGTFIALCNLLQEAEATGKMDFLSTLWRLRQDRMQMIQTVDQYHFLHRVALVGHMATGTSVPVSDISAKFKDLEGERGQPVAGYRQEFEAVNTVSLEDAFESGTPADDTHEVYGDSRTAMNKQKNRLSNILPKNAYRPELFCEAKSMGKYINAVLVPTLTKTRQDILTQLPLPSTVIDFWRLVTQRHVGLIVAFQADSRHTDETVGDFLPPNEHEPLRGALFEIQASTKEDHQLWREVFVTVHKKKKTLLGNTAEIQNLICLLCKTASYEPETVFEYMMKIQSRRPGNQSPTLYMCRNGAEYCGLVCVQSILLDRLDADHCLTVPLVVGAIKAIRPQVIPTANQYSCLYQVLKLAHDSSNIYSNIGAAEQPELGQGAAGCQTSSANHTSPASAQSENSSSSESKSALTSPEVSSGARRDQSNGRTAPTPAPRKSGVDRTSRFAVVGAVTDATEDVVGADVPVGAVTDATEDVVGADVTVGAVTDATEIGGGANVTADGDSGGNTAAGEGNGDSTAPVPRDIEYANL